VLRKGLGATFDDGSACHLDLVQWATSPKWGDLTAAAKRSLLEESLPHLKNQLKFGNVRLVLLNGREVLNQVARTGLASLEISGDLEIDPRRSCVLYSGSGLGAQFLGWSTNLQSSRGVTLQFKNRLAEWLAGAARTSEENVETGNRSMSEFGKAFDANGHVVKGTTVTSKFELLRLLQAWLKASAAPTISDAKPGRTPIIFMPPDHGRRMELNADTKRSAVEEYVQVARIHRDHLLWSVTPNRDGPYNKLVFRADRKKTPGWYCYLRPPASGPEEI
jgi:hypothetical protein